MALIFRSAALLAAIGVLLTWLYFSSRQKSKPKFPGPWQAPLIGRIHDLPLGAAWLKFTEWSREFGPIYQTSMVGKKFVIISDEELAKEVLGGKGVGMTGSGDHFGGRPDIRVLNGNRDGKTYFALMDRTDEWQKQRKFMSSCMATSSSAHFHDIIPREVNHWLASLLTNPGNFHQHTRELTGRVMARMVWDDVSEAKDFGDEAVERLGQLSMHSNVVNRAPFVWYLAEAVGWNPWKTYEMEKEGRMKGRWLRNFRVARRRFVEGSLGPTSWAHTYFSSIGLKSDAGLLYGERTSLLELSKEEEESAACMLGFGTMIGVVTIGTPLLYFMMAMLLHPDWQERVRQEVDEACCGRKPEVGDYERLPTLRAAIKEALRWRSSVPLGVPHRCERNTVVRGVEIEKDTVVMACEWALNRDPKKYPDPERYNPARYLDPSFLTYLEPLTQHPSFRSGHGMHTFGFGTRRCLGQCLADEELFQAAGALIWGFELKKKSNVVTGEEVEVDSEATNMNVILEPGKWEMDIKVREGREEVILRDFRT